MEIIELVQQQHNIKIGDICGDIEPNITEDNYKKWHYCKLPTKHHLYGQAIEDCFEDMDGYLFASNSEYGNQVNFCPMCGYAAKLKIEKGNAHG